MFEKLLRDLEDLNNQGISVPIEADSEGYLDKECPNKECLFKFKVKQQDWKNLFKDEAVFCPMCGHLGMSNSFWTTEQIGQAREQGLKYVKGIISKGFAEGAREFNRDQ